MSYILDALRKADAQRQRDPALGIHAQPARPVDGARAARARWGAGAWAACLAVAAALLALGWYVARNDARDPRAQAPVAVQAPSPVIAPVAPSPPVTTAVLPPPPPAAPPPAAPPVAAPPPPAPAVAVPPAPAPPVAATAAPAATGLPADAPKVVVTGGVYSVNPGQRMLIVNGQVFSEGAELGPGLVLQEIRAKSAVLTFRGSRYSVAY